MKPDSKYLKVYRLTLNELDSSCSEETFFDLPQAERGFSTCAPSIVYEPTAVRDLIRGSALIHYVMETARTGTKHTQLGMHIFIKARISTRPRDNINFFLFINIKMTTIVGILIFMSKKNSILGLSEPKKLNYLTFFTLMSTEHFMLS